MRFKDLLERATIDACFSLGCIRTAITAPPEARFGGYRKQAGEVSMDVISPDSLVYDTRAKTSFFECGYISHRYWVLYDDVKESGMFDKKARDKVEPTDEYQFNKSGDERASSISHKFGGRDDDYEERVELIEAYLPRLNKVVTFDANGDHDVALLEQDWIGPPCGPYTFLGMMPVPDNLQPKAPLMDLKRLDYDYNALWKKLQNQAFETKDVVAFLDAEDGNKFKAAPQGGWVQSSSPDSIKPIRIGGINQELFVQTLQNGKMFNEHAGNMAVWAGLASQAGTAHQEQMMQENSTVLIRSMSLKVLAFAQELMHNLGWFDWHHPHDNMEAEFHPPGLPEFSTKRVVRPIDRLGVPYEELDLRIDPYSMVYETPQSRVAGLRRMMREVIMPALPLFNQPGVGEMLQTYVRMEAKYTNNPDFIELLEKLVNIQGPPSDQPTGGSAPQTASAPGDHVYEHVSRPGMTDQGEQQVMSQLMLGSRPGGAGVEQLNGNGKY